MSIIKLTDVRCDLCDNRHEYSQVNIPGPSGRTKSSSANDARAEAKEKGWKRGKSKLGSPIDICPRCIEKELPEVVWFERDA